MHKIYVVGMPASGKSYWAKRWAESLQVPFMDTDAKIVEKTGMDIPSIFAQQGERAFRQIEQEVMRETFALQKAIIATGGGLPIYQTNMQQLNLVAITVYIQTPIEVLCQRLRQEPNQRPLIQQQENIENVLAQLLEQRAPYYQKATHLVIHGQEETFCERVLQPLFS
jgi:shikimate kinase